MKDIKIIKLDKYNNISNYEMVEEDIYKDLHDNDTTNFRIAMSFELEDGEDTQYPLEDILDKYYLYISDFLDNINVYNEKKPTILKLELAGEIDDVRNVKFIIGKRVRNEFSIDSVDGKTYIKLLIE